LILSIHYQADVHFQPGVDYRQLFTSQDVNNRPDLQNSTNFPFITLNDCTDGLYASTDVT